MQIWVDADACPGAIRDILFRAAARRAVLTTLVANRALRVPASPHLRAVQVPAGIDVADNHIAQQAGAGDLVVTADIPLAAAVIENGAQVLDPRGRRYTADNVRQRLVMRDFMEEFRATGLVGGGPPPLSQADRKAFADALDRYLTSGR